MGTGSSVGIGSGVGTSSSVGISSSFGWQRGNPEEFAHGARLDKPDQHAADAFEQAVESLDRNSSLENFIEQ